jgi:hypothetical protein
MRNAWTANRTWTNNGKWPAAKALQICVDESKAFPEIRQMFRAAFAALRKAQGD